MSRLVLVTGATGYVGGRLVPRLVERGYRVRCAVRRPESARERLPREVEIVKGDLLEPATLDAVMAGVDTAFYLVHALGSSGDLWKDETDAAVNFVRGAERADVRRIIYLGGLGGEQRLSPHLATRRAVGRTLRAGRVRVIELRSSIILGSGSLSFEMIRALVERLPVMVTPRWVSNRAQPIAIEDVIEYLLASIELPMTDNEEIEIGGADRASYLDLLREYARQRGLHRAILKVPLLTPRLSGLWLALVTPLHARVGRRLLEGVRNESVVTSDRAKKVFPQIQPRGFHDAIERALANEDREFAATHWSDPNSSGAPARSWHGVRFGVRRVDSRAVELDATAAQAFAPIARIGGTSGWYFANALWRFRGLVDLAAGGIGLRRGRRHPEQLVPGDSLDFWRVEAVEPNRLLRLHAEMRLPGRAWLQFEVTGDGPVVLRQTATFEPVGLFGLLYWYGLYPVHAVMFRGMLSAIARSTRRTKRIA
ncbi:MAG TPA: SDR family oxidoreductase [Gemmatimonadaceae bacterium]